MSAIELEVIAVEDVAERIRSIVLRPPARTKLPAYDAGAHVEVHLPDGDKRPYSLIDFEGHCNEPATYRLGVLLETDSSGGSAFIHGLKVGDTIAVDPPKNDFTLAGTDTDSILIAGGIGVTPIISMATALAGTNGSFSFHYAARSRTAAAFLDQLGGAFGEKLVPHFDDTAGGPLDVQSIVASAKPDAHLYVCGPKPMIEAARQHAENAGFTKDRIHFELFEAPAAQTGDTAFEVEVASTGAVFVIPPDKTIIDVLEEEGMDLIYDCQRGDCGICQTDVLEGVPDHRDVVLSDDERASNKLMQICVSRAKTPRLKLDL